jgi:hypothetical protein
MKKPFPKSQVFEYPYSCTNDLYQGVLEVVSEILSNIKVIGIYQRESLCLSDITLCLFKVIWHLWGIWADIIYNQNKLTI